MFLRCALHHRVQRNRCVVIEDEQFLSVRIDRKSRHEAAGGRDAHPRRHRCHLRVIRHDQTITAPHAQQRRCRAHDLPGTIEGENPCVDLVDHDVRQADVVAGIGNPARNALHLIGGRLQAWIVRVRLRSSCLMQREIDRARLRCRRPIRRQVDRAPQRCCCRMRREVDRGRQLRCGSGMQRQIDLRRLLRRCGLRRQRGGRSFLLGANGHCTERKQHAHGQRSNWNLHAIGYGEAAAVHLVAIIRRSARVWKEPSVQICATRRERALGRRVRRTVPDSGGRSFRKP